MTRANKHLAGSSFNSRTREGCDFMAEADDGTIVVSIHAPVKGAITLHYKIYKS